MLEVVIPKYIREVKLSNSIRPKYLKISFEDFRNNAFKVPEKYIKKEYRECKRFSTSDLKSDFQFVFNNKDKTVVLYNKLTNSPAILNEKKVGQPNIMRINAQDFYSGFSSPFIRGKIMGDIKLNMLPYLTSLPVITERPVRVELEIVDTIKNYTDKSKDGWGMRFDIDNRAYPYMKAFLDLLVTGKRGDVEVMSPK